MTQHGGCVVRVGGRRPSMTQRIAFAAAFLVALASLSGPARDGMSAATAARQDAAAQQPQPNMPDMMKMHERMMAEMKAGNDRLDAMLTQMNAASGNARVDAIAAVVTELAGQHKAMHERMGQMHQQMMGGRGMMGRGGMMMGR